MVIAIADDEKSVLDNFDAAIRRLQHQPLVRQSIRRMMDCVSDKTQPIDILFLDHHFKGEESGVSMIPEILAERPDLDIIVTTKQALDPSFVEEIVNAGVGFFKKSVVDPVWLDMEISQRVNVKQAKLDAIQRKIAEFVSSDAAPREGVFRLPFFRKWNTKGKKSSLKIVRVDKLPQQCIHPKFERFLTVHSGEVKDLSSEAVWEETLEVKAGTALEFGLKLSESSKFLGSQIGGQIISKLKTEHAVTERRTIRSTWRSSQKVQILDSEHKSGVRRKEFYRGVLHTVFKVGVEMSCTYCDSGSAIDLYFLFPESSIEICVAYDKMGMIHKNEDGRLGYRIWGGS